MTDLELTTAMPAWNTIRLVGTLDTPHSHDHRTTSSRYNDLFGNERDAVIQLPSPFGKPFRLPLRLDHLVDGLDCFTSQPPGTRLTIDGALTWVTERNRRDGERGAARNELLIRAVGARLATADELVGSDVWLDGEILTTPRVLLHPERPVRVAATTIRVTVEHQRRQSRARISEPAHIAVAIPLDHPDCEKLLRPGNRVQIEGMLERYRIPATDPDSQRALADLDAAWARHANPSRHAARDYQRQRQHLSETTRTRVIAGFVDLRQGEPLDLASANALREQHLRTRTARHARTGGPPPAERPNDADMFTTD